MLIYGLTGGTGSGKSLVAQRFVELGIPVVDVDALGHALLEPGHPVAEAVATAFGAAVLSCGRIDRGRLGAAVFAGAGSLRKLNAIVHPALRRAVMARCGELGRERRSLAVVDAALLAEDGKLDACLDGLIVVTASEETRCRRLVESRGISVEEAHQRIRSQTPPEVKVPLADWVIENEGTVTELYTRADAVAGEILGRGA